MDTMALIDKVIAVLRKETSSNIKYEGSDESGSIYVNVKNEHSDCDYSINLGLFQSFHSTLLTIQIVRQKKSRTNLIKYFQNTRFFQIV